MGINLSSAYMAFVRGTVVPPKRPTKVREQRLTVLLRNQEEPDLTLASVKGQIHALYPLNEVLTDYAEYRFLSIRKFSKEGMIVGLQHPTDRLLKVRRGFARPVDLTIEQYIDAWQWVRDYFSDMGVSFTSPGWTAQQLFRKQLKTPLTFSNPVGQGLIYPARGVCFPGDDRTADIEGWDIRAAYPAAMLANAHRVPGHFIPLDSPHDWDKVPLALVLAYVVTRPIPERQSPIIQEHPNDMSDPRSIVKWFWSFELETILNDFHYVLPLAAFKATTYDLTDEIGGFMEPLACRYDEGIGYRGKLLKSVANGLWGGFASSPIYAYKGKSPEKVIFPGQFGAEHVSGFFQALVSDRVYREILRDNHVLYWDTDGGYTLPLKDWMHSSEIGGWHLTGRYKRIEVAGWQNYAVHPDDGSEPRVKMAGVPEANYKLFLTHAQERERSGKLPSSEDLLSPHPWDLIHGVDPTRQEAWPFPIGGVSEIPEPLKVPTSRIWNTAQGKFYSGGWDWQAPTPVTERQWQALKDLAECDIFSLPDYQKPLDGRAVICLNEGNGIRDTEATIERTEPNG